MSENYEFEPDWINARKKKHDSRETRELSSLSSHPVMLMQTETRELSSPSSQPIMQTDDLKSFYTTIVTHGLQTAYLINRGKPFTPNAQMEGEVEKTEHPKNVVIIGAGMAGLVAAYELVRVGHKVRILEMQHRVGGRVKTVSSESFYPGLWSDGKYIKPVTASFIITFVYVGGDSERRRPRIKRCYKLLRNS